MKSTFGFCFVLFCFLGAAYGRSQARGRIGATAAGLHHSLSSTRSEPHLRATPQLQQHWILVVTVVARVAVVAWVRSLARDFPHAVAAAKKVFFVQSYNEFIVVIFK